MSSKPRATTPWARVCYGIDASGEHLRVVRGERIGRRLNWTEVPFDRDALTKAVAGGASVACGMPVGNALATWVRAPFRSATKALRVFPTLLDIQLPFPLEDCSYCFTEAHRQLHEAASSPPSTEQASATAGSSITSAQGGTVSALALAARNADVTRHLAMLSEMGIDPHSLDYEGVALWTQSLREHPTAPGTEGLLRVVVFLRGESGIMVTGRGTRFLSAHRIQSAEPMALGRFIRAHTNPSDSPVSVEWLWAGVGLGMHASGAGLRADVEQRWPGPSTLLDAPESFLARALATRALLPGPLRGNLRTGASVHRGAVARSDRSLIRTAAVLTVAGLLLCGAASWWEYTVAARGNALDAQFASTLNRVMGYSVKEKGAHAFLVAERELADRSSRRESLARAFEPSLLSDLERVLPGIGALKVQLASLSLTREGVQIKGSTAAKSVEAQLQEHFERQGYTSDITVSEAAADGRFTFVLNATSGGQHE